VVVVPQGIAENVIDKALVKASTEKVVRNAVEGGISATDALRLYGVL